MAQFGAKMASGWQCDIDSSHTKSTVGRRKIRISLMIPENELPHSLEVTLEFSLMIYLASGAGSGAFSAASHTYQIQPHDGTGVWKHQTWQAVSGLWIHSGASCDEGDSDGS